MASDLNRLIFRNWVSKTSIAAILLWSLILVMATSPASAQDSRSSDWRTAITWVATHSIPAVVHIEVTQKTMVSAPPFLEDPLFRRFFGEPNVPKKFKRELKGIGTGMLINPEGYILTNGHVVSGSTGNRVLLADGREFTAKVIGADLKTDLAVIKISAKEPFPFLKFANSDKVEVGEWVVAIGHPRGLNETVTQGIISAMHRRGISDPSSYQDFLQTDTPINPGNSGGPLLNLSGYIVGVNSAIASASGGFEGIGFAIPSNMAYHIAKELMSKGKITRGWLGVSIQDLTYDQARAQGLQTNKGSLVSEVAKNGPAEKAGLMKGDILLDYNGTAVADSGDLRNKVAITPIGQEVKMTILRDKKKMTLSVKVGNLEDSYKILAATVQQRLGGEFRPVTEKEAERYGLEQPTGVAVASLEEKGPLAEAGIEVNDIILGINGQMIENMAGFAGLLAMLPANRDAVLLVLDHRTGNTGTVRIRLK